MEPWCCRGGVCGEVRSVAVAEVVPGFEEGDLAPHPIYLAAALGGEVLESCVELSCGEIGCDGAVLRFWGVVLR